MTQSSLLTVGVWQKKSLEVAGKSKDRLISAVNKGFNAMAAVLTKDSAPADVHCALEYLSFERSLALKFDDAKNDPLRDLMYGILESLHGSLIEWTEERSQRKNSLQSLLEPPSHEAYLPIDNNASNDLTIPPPSFPIELKEESVDNYSSLPHDYQISTSELMRDEKMFMGEEMDNENTGRNFTHYLPLNSIVDPMDISQILPRDNQMPPLNGLRDEMEFKEEEMANDDVIVHRDSMEEDNRLEDVENSGMDDAVDNSLNEQPIEENDFLRTIQPSDVMDYQMNFDDEISGYNDQSLAGKISLNEVSMSDSHNETAEPESDEKNNDVIDNEGEEKEAVDHPTDTSDTVKKEKRRRSSRQVSGPIQYTEPVDDSDGDIGPSVKKLKTDSMKKNDNNGRSPKRGEKSSPPIKKSRVSKKNDTELECPECKLRTWSVRAWMDHLRLKHFTTPALAGLALLCACGHESLSDTHSRTCAHGNATVIRKRDGPIRRLDDEKATPQCVLCEFYPKTAHGYAQHLHCHHKSTLMQNGVYLKCSCGLEVRYITLFKHLDKCNPRQFSLHKRDDE